MSMNSYKVYMTYEEIQYPPSGAQGKKYLKNELIYFSGSEDERYIITSPTLTMEINKSGSFEFTLPNTNIFYEKEIIPLTTLVKIHKNDSEFWRGRVISIEKDFYLNKKIVCEGELGFLNDYVLTVDLDLSQGEVITGALWDIISDQLDIEGYTTNTNSSRLINSGDYTEAQEEVLSKYIYKGKLNEGDNVLDTLLNMVSQFPVFIKIGPDRKECPSSARDPKNYPEGVGLIRLYSLENQDFKSNQTIEFGKNLLDLTEFIDAESIITLVDVYGKKQSNGYRYFIKREVPYEYPNYPGFSTRISGFIQYDPFVERHGFVVKTLIFDELSKSTDLEKAAIDYLKKNMISNISIELSAFDLNSIDVNSDEFEIGQFVRIKSDPHGIDTNTVCSKIVLDFENPENNTYSFGLKYKSLSEQQVASDKKLSTAYDAAIGSIWQESSSSST